MSDKIHFATGQSDYNTALVELIKFAYENGVLTPNELRTGLGYPNKQGELWDLPTNNLLRK